MGLTYDYSNIRNPEELHGANEADATPEQSAEYIKTQYLCFALMGADINSITKENWKDVWARVMMWQKLAGNIIILDQQPYYYTAQDIERRIGYGTNVSNKTWNQWLNKMKDMITNEALRTASTVSV